MAGTLAPTMNSVTLDVVAQKQNVGEPWLWKMGRDFDVVVNVKRANVDLDYGFVEVELTGALEEIQRATTWLLTTGLHVEAQTRSMGS